MCLNFKNVLGIIEFKFCNDFKVSLPKLFFLIRCWLFLFVPFSVSEVPLLVASQVAFVHFFSKYVSFIFIFYRGLKINTL